MISDDRSLRAPYYKPSTIHLLFLKLLRYGAHTEEVCGEVVRTALAGRVLLIDERPTTIELV